MSQPNDLRVSAQAQYGFNPIYTPHLVDIISVSSGVADAYKIVQTGPDGKIDASFAPSSILVLETNSVLNPNQNLFNLKQGTNITIVADAFGGVTINASGSFSTDFGSVTSGTNTTATMTVDTGAVVSFANAGVINASKIGGIGVAGNVPAHPKQTLVSQLGNTSATWQDPVGITTMTAGENVNAFQVVAVHGDGLAYKADAGNAADADRIVGVAITSASTGNTLQVQQIGVIDNLGFSFTPGAWVYLGNTGALVQTPNTGAFEQPMGVALSATRVEIEIGLPIIFA